MAEREHYRVIFAIGDQGLLQTTDVFATDSEHAVERAVESGYVRGEVWVAPTDAFDKFRVEDSVEVVRVHVRETEDIPL